MTGIIKLGVIVAIIVTAVTLVIIIEFGKPANPHPGCIVTANQTRIIQLRQDGEHGCGALVNELILEGWRLDTYIDPSFGLPQYVLIR